ncbi:MAG TPA: hypothetical protein VIT45_11155 [Allosphingosinicella sp.]
MPARPNLNQSRGHLSRCHVLFGHGSGSHDHSSLRKGRRLVERSDPELSRRIFDEIDRAQIHSDGDLPEKVVAIGSEVEFVDEKSGDVRP